MNNNNTKQIFLKKFLKKLRKRLRWIFKKKFA